MRGSEIERKVGALLGGRVNWAAPHIRQGVTWAELAVENPTGSQEDKK